MRWNKLENLLTTGKLDWGKGKWKTEMACLRGRIVTKTQTWYEILVIV